MDIGEEMISAGAEVHRVEQSVSSMCRACGAEDVDVFIIPTSMIVTVCTSDGERYTQTKRMLSSAVDYERLHRLNQLSREICATPMTEKEMRAALQQISRAARYPFWLTLLTAAVIAAAFTVFFGGGLVETVVSFFIALAARLGMVGADSLVKGRIFSRFASTVIASLLSFAAVGIGVVSDVDKIMIGNIMTLIPGLGLTNALRDLFSGDSIAGLWRTVESLLIAIGIAAGYVLVASIGGMLI